MRFVNLYPHRNHHPGHVLQWKFGFRRESREEVEEHFFDEDDLLAQAADREMIRNPGPGTIQVTWIGHACFLLQVGGVNLLVDPVFREYCAPVPVPGFRRLHPPGLTLDELPPVDGVLITHNHYDHLESQTIRALGEGVSCFVPAGLESWMRRRGKPKTKGFAWWDSESIGDDCVLHCVPAQHFSSRSFHDRNATLWCGWIVEIGSARVYIVGDTGYCPVFPEIRERIGAMDVSIIPIGAYRPRWLMHPVHVDPREAVQIHLDVESRVSVASHWGTFQLTDEPLDEPPALLRKAMMERAVDLESFRVLRVGEILRVGDSI